MKYDEVEDAHIVPAGYLRGFANGSMTMRYEVATGRVRERPVKRVGTRKRAYSRTRPKDGSRIDDVEWSLSKLENKVEVVRQAAERFPFSEEDRSIIAQFAGCQHVRGPKWASQHQGSLERFMAEIQREGLDRFSPIVNEVMKPAILKQAAKLGTDTARLADMQKWVYATTAVFYAMHWTLIRFNRPLICTCDHPVTLWPANGEPRYPSDGTGIGLMNTLEVRYPLTSQLCLLMTWRDKPDAPEIRIGNNEKARNLNGFTKAGAEEEWFHRPGESPPLPGESDRLLPLSPLIYPDYGVQAVRSSQRRRAAIRAARLVRSEPLTKEPTFPAITIGPESSQSG